MTRWPTACPSNPHPPTSNVSATPIRCVTKSGHKPISPYPHSQNPPHAMTNSKEKNQDCKYVITVGRQFGSGGREFARHIADAFEIGYYDKELLLEAARHAGVDAGFFERSDEKFPTFTTPEMADGRAAATRFDSTMLGTVIS